MPDPPPSRYAIYYAPPKGSALDRFGRRWLGRDARSNRAVAQPKVSEIAPARLAALTAAPRRYGFHATLKAPFALAEDATVETLADALAAFAGTSAPIAAGRLRIADLRGFLALTLAEDRPAVRVLADACVEAFQPLARPLTEAEVARRGAGLTARQRARLERWSYPYVFEDYLFHMTLTGPVESDESTIVAEALRAPLADILADPLEIDALTLFVEDRPGADFRIVDRFPLTGRAVAHRAPASY